MIKRIAWFALGMAHSARKGAMLPLLWFYQVHPKKNMLWHWFGFNAPELEHEWERIDGNEPLSHTTTNIVVEWVRSSAQRAAKLGCAMIVFPWLIVILQALL